MGMSLFCILIFDFESFLIQFIQVQCYPVPFGPGC